MEADLIAYLLSDSAVECEGSHLDDNQLIEQARECFQGRQVYVVRDWIVLDVMHSDVACAQLSQEDLQSTVVYAHHVVYDSSFGTARPGAIRSSYQRAFSEFIFETKASVFILAGPGRRKYASVPAVLALDAG